MTADDVVWSLKKRWLDPATQWRCLSEFSATGIEEIEAMYRGCLITLTLHPFV